MEQVQMFLKRSDIVTEFAGMLQMLLDTQLDATQQDFARTAQASGKALVTLINEVLDQAKIESGRIELEAVPFDLRAILDDVLSLFCGKTRGEGIEVGKNFLAFPQGDCLLHFALIVI